MLRTRSIDEYSLISIPMSLLCNHNIIGEATGFFYAAEGHRYLVSNWHVFSGRNSYSGQPNHPDAAIPDALRVALHLSGSMPGVQKFDIRLYDADGRPNWRQHPLGQDFDVAAMSCRNVPAQCLAFDLPLKSNTLDMAFLIGMDAYILGYPKGIANNGIFPIWKRASVASEPDLPHDGKPLVLVDTATREGMSGAPVFLRTFGGYRSTSGNQNMIVGPSTRFIGVYSGRYSGGDEFAAQLGRVWLREVIDEVIRKGVAGSYELR